MGRDMLLAAKDHVGRIVFADDCFTGNVLGIPVIRPAEIGPGDEVILAIGDGAQRKRIVQQISMTNFARIVAPTALLGPAVELGEGTIICDGAKITSATRVGRHCIVNIGALLGHDIVIGDYVTISPGAICCSNVIIEDGAFVGAGATIRQGEPGKPLHIGAGAIIGMGAVVIENVPPAATVVGNPAQKVERPSIRIVARREPIA